MPCAMDVSHSISIMCLSHMALTAYSAQNLEATHL